MTNAFYIHYEHYLVESNSHKYLKKHEFCFLLLKIAGTIKAFKKAGIQSMYLPNPSTSSRMWLKGYF